MRRRSAAIVSRRKGKEEDLEVTGSVSLVFVFRVRQSYVQWVCLRLCVSRQERV